MDREFKNPIGSFIKSFELSICLAATLYFCGTIFRATFLINFGILGLIKDDLYTKLYYGSLPLIETSLAIMLIYCLVVVAAVRGVIPKYLQLYMFPEQFIDSPLYNFAISTKVICLLALFVSIAFLTSVTMAKISIGGLQQREGVVSYYLSDNSIVTGTRIASDEEKIAVLVNASSVVLIDWSAVKKIQR